MDADKIRYLLWRKMMISQFSRYRWSVLISALDSRFLRACFPDTNLYLIDPWDLNPSYLNSDGPVCLEKSHMKEAFDRVQNYLEDDPLTHILKKHLKKLLV